MKKMIYISDEGVWESVRGAARVEGRSVSNYLLNLHRERVKNEVQDERVKGVVEKVPYVSKGSSELRERLKAMRPNDICLGCRQLNVNCVCDV